MALKQDGVHFPLCPKQDNQIEGGVLKVCILRIFLVLHKGQVFCYVKWKEPIWRSAESSEGIS